MRLLPGRWGWPPARTGSGSLWIPLALSACLRGLILLRERRGVGNLGLRNPRSIMQARALLFEMFGGKVPVRPADTNAGERPYLLARVGADRSVLLEAAASAAGCVKCGSGG
jgi:hypothetical protein